MSGWMDGFNWVVRIVLTDVKDWASRSYIDPNDKDEDDTSKIQYKTVVTYREPLRPTKCLFVTEMSDFFSPSELNRGYHRKEEYDEAIQKFGYIYKSQKFENADTPQKLLDYATDWIKNNYHGGLTSFSITALDMHLAGNQDTEKYTVGRRVRVRYPDPISKQQTEQVLTVISAEYDLYNPDKNSYKIGIPDSTLSKVYGETSKKGGGGGGGKNTSSQNDTEDGTEMEGLTDQMDGSERTSMENFWAHIQKKINAGATEEEISEYLASALQTPGERDPGSDFSYALVSDVLKTGDIKAAIGEFATSLRSKYIVSQGAVEAKKVESDTGNITAVTSRTITNEDTVETKDLEASNNVKATNNVEATETVKGKNVQATNNITASNNVEATEQVKGKNVQATNNVTASNNVEATEKVIGKHGEFSDSLTLGGVSVATMDDIPDVPSTHTVDVTIGSKTYRLYGKEI